MSPLQQQHRDNLKILFASKIVRGKYHLPIASIIQFSNTANKLIQENLKKQYNQSLTINNRYKSFKS